MGRDATSPRLAADCTEAALDLDCAAHPSINECRSSGGALAYETGSSGMMVVEPLPSVWVL
jgi:hypothetical protein